MANRLPCYVIIELTAGEPVGIHTFPLTEDGLDDVCEVAVRMWEEQELKVDFADSDIEEALKKYSYFRKKNTHADYALHIHKSVKE